MRIEQFQNLTIYKPEHLPGWENLDVDAARKLDRLTVGMGRSTPLDILSLYRSTEKNQAVGGAKDSMHLYGKAIDFVVPGDPVAWYRAAEKVGFAGIGVYINPANAVSMHVDIRPTGAARWSRVDGVMSSIDSALERIIAVGLSAPVQAAGKGVILGLTIFMLWAIFRRN
jgi:hypothetical protein